MFTHSYKVLPVGIGRQGKSSALALVLPWECCTFHPILQLPGRSPGGKSSHPHFFFSRVRQTSLSPTMHACLLEIHGIQGSALVTCLGIRVFCSRPSWLSHSTTPTLDPSLTQQAAASVPGACLDLDQPGVAAAHSSGCTRVSRSPGSQGHPREAVSQRGPVVAALACPGSCAVTAALLGADISSCPCQLFPMVAWPWPAALWAQHFPPLIPTTVLLDALGNTW